MALGSKLKTIITGVTGMVGEGVLHECLLSDAVSDILVINRKPCGVVHPKLKQIIHADFFDITGIEDQLSGYNACFFCLGVSSVGMEADNYYRLTYTLTLNFAGVLNSLNPDMTFCYISGKSTDTTEQGKIRWARVKGKTENDLMKLPFKKVYNFRPGVLIATKGLKNTQPLYKYFSWLVPVIKLVYPNGISSLKQLGQAMIWMTINGYDKQHIEVVDISAIIKE